MHKTKIGTVFHKMFLIIEVLSLARKSRQTVPFCIVCKGEVFNITVEQPIHVLLYNSTCVKGACAQKGCSVLCALNRRANENGWTFSGCAFMYLSAVCSLFATFAQIFALLDNNKSRFYTPHTAIY
jgi:hypothetical protein